MLGVNVISAKEMSVFIVRKSIFIHYDMGGYMLKGISEFTFILFTFLLRKFH